MTSCVEKLNVLLDHWAFFENNNTYPDLTHWKKVIKQEYKDDKMDAVAAAADAAEDEEGEEGEGADYDIPITSDNPAPASDTCIPLPNDSRCSGKINQNLNYTTYCPFNCNLKNKCVTKASHCKLTLQRAMADNSKDIGQDKNNMRLVKAFMIINNQAKK